MEQREKGILPEFEINTENSVLVKFDAGKKYHNQEAQNQEPQKGDTCWYYGPNKLRIRAGKFFDDKQNKYREIEKLISRHRKIVTSFTAARSIDQNLVSGLNGVPGCDKKIIDKQLVNDILIPFFEKAKVTTGKTDFDNLLISFKDYLKTDFPTFSKYIENANNDEIYSMNMIRSAQGTLSGLKELGVNVDSIIKQELKLRKIDDIDKQSPSAQRVTYHNIIRHVAWECFGLKASAWNPEQGLAGLMQTLRNEGSLVVLGRFGVPSYSAEPHPFESQDLKKIGSCDILGWKPEEFKTGNNNLHEIVIVGASKIKGKDFVFFLDPHQPSNTGENRAVIMMSYDRLMKGLGNIYGQRAIASSSTTFDSLPGQCPGPFATCKDPQKMREITQLLDKSALEVVESISMSSKPGDKKDDTPPPTEEKKFTPVKKEFK